MKSSGIRLMRILAILLCVCLAAPVPVQAEDAQSAKQGQTEAAMSVTSNRSDRIAYYYYIREYSDAAKPRETIEVKLEPVEEYSNAASPYQNLEGSEKGLRIGDEEGQVTFRAEIPESGLYNIALTYLALAESSAALTVGILIDQELPYAEAYTCPLSRTFLNGGIRQDEEGNDVRPNFWQAQVWQTEYLSDQTGVNGELYFYLEKGEHLITLVTDGVPFLLESMTIGQKPTILSYEDYISLHRQKGHSATEGIIRKVQAEQVSSQSSSMLWPISDRTSPLTEPFDYSLTKLNTVGGSQWKTPGQWISWEVEVPEDGFYHIGIKYRQNYLEGLYSSRRILIDGEVPFAEFERVRFDYDSEWQMKTLGNEYGEPYSIYLTAGTHTLTMENVIGDLDTTLDVLQTAISNLNELYISIVMVTGTDPDPYRDYYIRRTFPELADELTKNANMLFAEAERLVELVGEKGSESAFLENIAYDLLTYAKDVEGFTYEGWISNLKTNITSLSNKVSELGEQALDIDYFVIESPDIELPDVTPSFWQWVKYHVGLFVSSFTTTKQEEEMEERTVRVWMTGGNEQYQIMKDMIADMFTPETGITVDLELSSGSLVQASVSGIGPDVSIGVDADTVVNLALRGALQDVSGLPGFEELQSEFIEGSFVPFMLEGKTYGVPNTNAFTMMFVRTDIFEDLGLSIPTTWDEMRAVVRVLQRNNMEAAVDPGFATLLYQNGGSYFDEGLTKVLFTEEIAIDAFTQVTENYTKYGYPLTYDFANRFRTGEMPVGLAEYTLYNTLQFTAPELNGLWEMVPMPGTVREDGTVDYTQVEQNGTGTVLLDINDNVEAGWEFMRWWCGAEAQARYAKDLEAALGTVSRYTPVNLKAFKEIDWSAKEQQLLLKQAESLVYMPNVPGGYYIARGINNAFRSVLYDGANVRKILTNWTTKINEEIARKRAEFQLNN